MRSIPRSRGGAPSGGQSHERPHPHVGVGPLATHLWPFQRQVPASVRGPRRARDEAARLSPQPAVSFGGISATLVFPQWIWLFIFSHCCSYIHSKNRAGLSFSLALNSLSDRAMPELLAMRGRKRSNKPNHGLPFEAENYKGVKVPESIDWRLYGELLGYKCTSFISFCAFTLCSCRRRHPSERPGHLRLLLEFCYHWGNRGRTLPEGEQQR